MSRRDPAASHHGPLAGLRVVDLTTSYAGPTATMYLADLGADVIKVERAGGDDARSWGPPFADGSSAWFASANRNKRSVVLDLRSPAGRTALMDLIDGADVFIQNLNPAKLVSLGLDHPTITATRPHLIYCAISGWGLDGPSSDLPGYDLAAQARSGLMSVTGAKGGPPQRVSTALSDVVTGMCAALAISAAVVRQRAEGIGDLVDVSLLDSDLALMAPRVASYLAGDPEPRPSGGTDSVLAVYQAFPTADRDIVVAIGNDAMWVRFCHAVGCPELADEPELATNAGRRIHRDRVVARVEALTAGANAAHWLRALGAVDVPASIVQTLSEVVADDQVVARGALLPVPDSEVLHSVHSPFRLGSIAEPRNQRFPDLGEHTAEVLAELGYDDDGISLVMGAASRSSAGAPGKARS